MNKRYLLLSLSFLSTMYGRTCCPPGIDDHILVRADGMYLRRSNFPERTLAQNTAITDANGNPKSVIKSENLAGHWDWKPGYYGNLTYFKSEKSSVEALYYYVLPWHAREVTGAAASLAFPFHDSTFTTDFINASFVEAKYISQLQNGEFNLWRHLTPRRINYFSASWILGFRFMYLGEKLRLTYTQSSNVSDYDIKARNYLYGLQLGGVLEINPGPRWTWTVIIKGAGFANEAFSK
ncbi:MAG TPA: hypothetical protein VLF61_00265, partial [Rhabdochlamydiaceae bacterium]|nr:hypothetical protein [Rhabdochlamydiaceae bacterium]